MIFTSKNEKPSNISEDQRSGQEIRVKQTGLKSTYCLEQNAQIFVDPIIELNQYLENDD